MKKYRILILISLIGCFILKEESYVNIHFPFKLSNKYLLGAGPYNPFSGEKKYLYRNHIVPQKNTSRGKCTPPFKVAVREYFDNLLSSEFCILNLKKDEFSYWSFPIGKMYTLLCHDQSEKINKDECICVVYWELKDPKGFKETLQKASSCPEKVDEMIVDIDSE